MVERLAIVNGVLDDLLICETGWAIFFFSVEIFYKHSFCGSFAYFFVFFLPYVLIKSRTNQVILTEIWQKTFSIKQRYYFFVKMSTVFKVKFQWKGSFKGHFLSLSIKSSLVERVVPRGLLSSVSFHNLIYKVQGSPDQFKTHRCAVPVLKR